VLIWRFLRTGGRAMLSMMGGAPDHMAAQHDHRQEHAHHREAHA
jgi:hypothetical protein